MKRFVSFLLFMALGTLTLLGQARQVTGTVVSADNGEPLPGVTVSVKGTSVGTITGSDGTYSINVPQDGEIPCLQFRGASHPGAGNWQQYCDRCGHGAGPDGTG